MQQSRRRTPDPKTLKIQGMLHRTADGKTVQNESSLNRSFSSLPSEPQRMRSLRLEDGASLATASSDKSDGEREQVDRERRGRDSQFTTSDSNRTNGGGSTSTPGRQSRSSQERSSISSFHSSHASSGPPSLDRSKSRTKVLPPFATEGFVDEELPTSADLEMKKRYIERRYRVKENPDSSNSNSSGGAMAPANHMRRPSVRPHHRRIVSRSSLPSFSQSRSRLGSTASNNSEVRSASESEGETTAGGRSTGTTTTATTHNNSNSSRGNGTRGPQSDISDNPSTSNNTLAARQQQLPPLSASSSAAGDTYGDRQPLSRQITEVIPTESEHNGNGFATNTGAGNMQQARSRSDGITQAHLSASSSNSQNLLRAISGPAPSSSTTTTHHGIMGLFRPPSPPSANNNASNGASGSPVAPMNQFLSWISGDPPDGAKKPEKPGLIDALGSKLTNLLKPKKDSKDKQHDEAKEESSESESDMKLISPSPSAIRSRRGGLSVPAPAASPPSASPQQSPLPVPDIADRSNALTQSRSMEWLDQMTSSSKQNMAGSPSRADIRSLPPSQAIMPHNHQHTHSSPLNLHNITGHSDSDTAKPSSSSLRVSTSDTHLPSSSSSSAAVAAALSASSSSFGTSAPVATALSSARTPGRDMDTFSTPQRAQQNHHPHLPLSSPVVDTAGFNGTRQRLADLYEHESTAATPSRRAAGPLGSTPTQRQPAAGRAAPWATPGSAQRSPPSSFSAAATNESTGSDLYLPNSSATNLGFSANAGGNNGIDQSLQYQHQQLASSGISLGARTTSDLSSQLSYDDLRDDISQPSHRPTVRALSRSAAVKDFAMAVEEGNNGLSAHQQQQRVTSPGASGSAGNFTSPTRPPMLQRANSSQDSSSRRADSMMGGGMEGTFAAPRLSLIELREELQAFQVKTTLHQNKMEQQLASTQAAIARKQQDDLVAFTRKQQEEIAGMKADLSSMYANRERLRHLETVVNEVIQAEKRNARNLRILQTKLAEFTGDTSLQTAIAPAEEKDIVGAAVHHHHTEPSGFLPDLGANLLSYFLTGLSVAIKYVDAPVAYVRQQIMPSMRYWFDRCTRSGHKSQPSSSTPSHQPHFSQAAVPQPLTYSSSQQPYPASFQYQQQQQQQQQQQMTGGELGPLYAPPPKRSPMAAMPRPANQAAQRPLWTGGPRVSASGGPQPNGSPGANMMHSTTSTLSMGGHSTNTTNSNRTVPFGSGGGGVGNSRPRGRSTGTGTAPSTTLSSSSSHNISQPPSSAPQLRRRAKQQQQQQLIHASHEMERDAMHSGAVDEYGGSDLPPLPHQHPHADWHERFESNG